MLFTNLNQLLSNGRIYIEDEFIIGGRRHKVSSNHCYVPGSPNDGALIKYIGASYREVLSRIYGYPTETGEWPVWDEGDMKAAFNVTCLLFALQEEKDRLVEIHPNVGDTIVWRWDALPFFNIKDSNGIVQLGKIVNVDGSTIRLSFNINGEDVSFWAHNSSIIIVQSVNSLLTNKIPQQDGYLQKSSVTDKREEGSSGTGIPSGGSTTTIGRGPAGNAQGVEEGFSRIREGQVRGTILKF